MVVSDEEARLLDEAFRGGRAPFHVRCEFNRQLMHDDYLSFALLARAMAAAGTPHHQQARLNQELQRLRDRDRT